MAELPARVWGLFSRDCAEYAGPWRPMAEALRARLDGALRGPAARIAAAAVGTGPKPAADAGAALLRATVREAHALYLVLVELRGLAVAAGMTPAPARPPAVAPAPVFTPGLPLEYEELAP